MKEFSYLSLLKEYPTFAKFIKFGIVGFSGFIIDFGTTYLLKEKARIQKYVANACGFILAATSNYLLNRYWTFHSKDPDMVLQFGRFFIVSLIGLGFNTLILWTLVSKLRMHFYLSKLAAILLVMVWNFYINLAFTFS